MVKAIGLDAGATWQQANPAKEKLSRDQWLDQNYFAYWYPLMEWGFNREKCKQIIAAAGLPVPLKSACFLLSRQQKARDPLAPGTSSRIDGPSPGHRTQRPAKLKTVKGLGRSFSWESYLAACNDLPLLDCCVG